MPGSVSVACSSDMMPEHQDQVHHQADVREPAEQAIERRHEADDEHEPDRQRDRAGADRVGAQFGADAALLHHRQRRRQRAGAQQHGQVVGAWRR